MGNGTQGGFVCEASCTEVAEGSGAVGEDLHIFVTVENAADARSKGFLRALLVFFRGLLMSFAWFSMVSCLFFFFSVFDWRNSSSEDCQASSTLLAYATSCAVDQCDRPIFGPSEADFDGF